MIFCKDNLKTVYSLLLHPKYLLKNNTRVFKSRIKGEKDNSLTIQDSWVSGTGITFQGTGNRIIAHDCHLFNSSLFIRGSGHSIIIESGVQFFNVRLKIIGRNNVIHIGKNTQLGGGNIIHGGDSLTISIGSDCFLAEGFDIWSTDTHSILEKASDESCTNSPESIHIGDHVWFGKDVTILKGVTIGKDAVIGMKSLVTKNVQEGSLNVGIPSRQIRSGITWNSLNPTNG